MKSFLDVLLKIAFGVFFVMTSVYCLLAFLPYTYYALIKAPTFAWFPQFAQHHVLLFWLASIAAVVAYHDQKKTATYIGCFGTLTCAGIYLSAHPFLADIQNNKSAYWVGIASLSAVILVVLLCGSRAITIRGEDTDSSHISFSTGLLLAVGIALLNVAAAEFQFHADASTSQARSVTACLVVWSLICHALVAIVFVAIVNGVRTASSKLPAPRVTRWVLFSVLVFGSIWALAVRFLEKALNFDGWPAHLYAILLAATFTLLGFSTALPFLSREGLESRAIKGPNRTMLVVVCIALALATIESPRLLEGKDWDGVIQGTVTLAIWVAASACFFRLLPRSKKYSVQGFFGTVLLGFLSCGLLVRMDLVWSWPLGDTHVDIEQSLESYAERDPSFNLAYHLLGMGRSSKLCEFCRTLRQYTEISDAKARFDVKLVDPLVPARGNLPNIFFFVIDSMRPDYLGAYNPKATFTPNIDALARDGVVLHNVYTPYAGTSLSEPAIWAGTLLLHAHYMRPFERVNGLEKLVKADDYQMVVSYDEILREILSPSDDVIKLDTDKKIWTQLELCSTIRQAEKVFDRRSSDARPIFFYTQPKNVHQTANNDLPRYGKVNFSAPAGFHFRIALEVHQVDSCLGGFIAWLKSRNMYDNSILIVTSDHGQATGEFGREGHSLILYPQDVRVPLIMHLPKSMQGKYVHDDNRMSALIDITPSLYYLLGHRPIISNPLFGRPLFAETQEELHKYPREELFMASDAIAAYGILANDGRYFYATYASPEKSYLYDLELDPNGEHDILTDALKKKYDARILAHLRQIADFYGYTPELGLLLHGN